MDLDKIIEVEHKIDEFTNLNNRLRRYWKRLTKESLKIAKDNYLSIRLEESFPHLATDIAIYEKEGVLDDSKLIILSKQRLPSLYRRYTQGLEKQRLIESELRDVYHAL